MKGIVHRRYGVPELGEVDEPRVMDRGVRVRVHATSLNAMDWYILMGRPYPFRMALGLRRPAARTLGTDLAGTVEAVGRDVHRFRPGDLVYGAHHGTLVEYACVPEDSLAPKPSNLTFEQAAAVPVAGLTALQALRDRAGPVHEVLINGAAGGVGTFAVQIAKALGARVTGVCGTAHVETIRAIGADQVVDYTREDFTRVARHYDLIVDVAGSRSWQECRRVLAPRGIFVLVGGPRTNPWLGPLGHFARVRLGSMGDSRRVVFCMASVAAADLVVMNEFLESGRVVPVIDRRYDLSEIAEAFAYLGAGHAGGKVVVRVSNAAEARK